MKNRIIYFAIIVVILVFNINPMDHYVKWCFGERLNINREKNRMVKVRDDLIFGTGEEYIFFQKHQLIPDFEARG